MRHLGEHPDVLDLVRLTAPFGGYLGLLHEVALLGPCRQQQVASGLHGFNDYVSASCWAWLRRLTA